ncbi:hypothetical protein K402DRAFT_394756 [Aulographum hederae CBS 113979]|uniref:Calponin-homology (CH) domain-containing protein n=1 Tax=Aulographum hederae CBS 113979 TaxID=1176131 RepID=A0A6G1GWS9_9PEZI|nr:hypothetical protein K402DRAFT_394756 [Aulographum hederae CBS 113979]
MDIPQAEDNLGIMDTPTDQPLVLPGEGKLPSPTDSTESLSEHFLSPQTTISPPMTPPEASDLQQELLTPRANVMPGSEATYASATDVSGSDYDADERTDSPSPTISPTLALSAVPNLDRSLSSASSVSSVSGRSSSSRLSDGASTGRRNGYIRPQGTSFANSAVKRESVMNLGSIIHLQYYFARTGLLEGKGGHSKSRKSSAAGGAPGDSPQIVSSSPDSYTRYTPSGMPVEPKYQAEPEMEQLELEQDDQGAMMLAPTVSTYRHPSIYVPPPPDMDVLRRELRENLEATLKVCQEVEKAQDANFINSPPPNMTEFPAGENQGWHEVQGVNLLDVTTLAIRAAKNYYTAHEQPQKLYAIKSERQIRCDLYGVLDVLKRMANRKFSGGIQWGERVAIVAWVDSILKLLKTEEEQERAEQAEWESRKWTSGDWTGKEHKREWLFLRSFVEDPEQLPEWTDVHEEGIELPTPFLKQFQNGLRLVKLHNSLVKQSKRQFEDIKVFHTDTTKPYRCAENLRYWVKAAELRWETKIEVDVMGVVNNTNEAAWRGFDKAILTWCQGVRKEITADWQESKRAAMVKMPTFMVEEDGLQ